MMSRLLHAALAAASFALALASPGQANAKPVGRAAHPVAQTARHPLSGLPVIPLRIRAHTFRVEVARTEPEQQRGLMFRTEMGANEGMIFLRQPPDHAAFWMRNTVIPLDIIFIGRDRRILNIAHGAPYDETPLPSRGVAAAVLELNGGRAAQLGIGPGDRVDW